MLAFKNYRTLLFLLLVTVSVSLPLLSLAQAPSLLKKLRDKVDASADSLEFVGGNIIAEGNVVVKYKNYTITCDKAIVNVSTKDIEAVGNVTFTTIDTEYMTISPEQLEKLKKNYHTVVKIEDYIVSPTGKQRIEVSITRKAICATASRASGNFSTGAMEFKNLFVKAGVTFVSAASAVRAPDGVIKAKDVKFSTCEYMTEDHEHYSVKADKATIQPSGMIDPALQGYNMDFSEHEIWAYNCTGYIGDVPVIWLPVVYKPHEEHLPYTFQFQAGYDSQWGGFALMSKGFSKKFLDNKLELSGRAHFDLYSKRGIGWGLGLQMKTEKTYTEFFGYNIYDMKPYGVENGSYFADTSRLKIPHFRYDYRLSHLSHITPRLDLRGHLEVLSDNNFLQDFFIDRAKNDPQPVTFADLEYQADRFTASINVRPRMNNFFTVVERLPEMRLDFQRQELFKNIYYQGETTFAYLRTRWRKFDRDRTTGNRIDPKDYDTTRFDSLHMLYFPMNYGFFDNEYLNWLNIIPRAGLRFTNYNRTSKNKINTQNLETMFTVDTPDGDPEGDVVNYDVKNRNRFRVVGEIGLEANTKIYRTWNNVKNAFWELDGLRHVMKPYVNYTFIPQPTVNRNKILYFDDIDRIDEQNFVRFGLKQALQTRRGTYGQERIYQWASLENYFDFHFNKESGYSNFGDFGTRFSFTPNPDLSITTDILLNAGQEDAPSSKTVRAGEVKEAKGISQKWINRWETTINYKIMEDLEVFARYNFQNNYRARSLYSMGSSLEYLNSTSSFGRYYGRRQTLGAGIMFPLPFDDHKTKLMLSALYDVEGGYIRENKIRIARSLHCWQVALELAQRRNRNDDGGTETTNSVMFMLSLTDTPGQKLKMRPSPATRSSQSF